MDCSGDKYTVTLITDKRYILNTKDFFKYLKFINNNKRLNTRDTLNLLGIKFIEEDLNA
jgi:hypothetical protein